MSRAPSGLQGHCRPRDPREGGDRGDDSGKDCEVLFTIKKYASSEIKLDFTLGITMLRPSRSTRRGAPSGGVLKAGSGSGTCERWRTQPRPRAVLGQPRRALWTRPGPTTVKGIKAKMPRWRAARRGA